jgi:hypothetical protein
MRHRYGQERWAAFPEFNSYEISTYGRTRNVRTGHIKAQREYGDVFLMKHGKLHRVNPTQAALKAFN